MLLSRSFVTVALGAALVSFACSRPKIASDLPDDVGGEGGSEDDGDDPDDGEGGRGGRAGSAGGNDGGGRSGGGGSAGRAPLEEVVDPDAGAGGGTAKISCGDGTYRDRWMPGYQPDEAVLAQVKNVVSSMSLAERADQMRGTPHGNRTNYSDTFRTLDNQPRSIRGWKFRDGPRGVNLAAERPAGKRGYSTSFPVPMARAAAFDLDLEERVGVAIGDETLASRNTMMLAPTVNILRHPGWGRAQETYGEDSYLLGRMGAAFTVGVQQFVPACVKHYAANNIENGRNNANAIMDEQTLREVYGWHFERIVRDAGVACVMAAYNPVNGKKSSQNKHLLTDLLRKDWGFRGVALTDWWAMPDPNNADAAKSFAAEAIGAGLDMELPWALNFQQIESITGAGRPLGEALITEAASRILEQKFRFKVARLDQPMGLKRPQTTLSDAFSIEANEAHVTLAEEAARKGMVLLKNEGGVLPLKRGTTKKVAVLGANVPYRVVFTDLANGTINFATDVRLGDLGSARTFSDPAKSVGPFAGIKAAAGNGVEVVTGSTASVGRDADVVVVVAGLTPQDEGEEYTGAGDRANFLLDGKLNGKPQNDLINQAAALGKPVVVVLEAGSVVEMPWLSKVQAVVMAWYPGMAGGKALGALLFGDANFSGKLPISWPKSWNDLPALSGGTSTQMDYELGYRYYDRKKIEPLFPFGHGLSYSKFRYANLQVPCSDVTKSGVVEIKVDVKNDSAVPGDEVVFLFVSYPETKARRSVKELKGFARVALAPGQTKRVTLPLPIGELRFWSMQANRWEIETGPVRVHVGGSSAELPLEDTLVVK